MCLIAAKLWLESDIFKSQKSVWIFRQNCCLLRYDFIVYLLSPEVYLIRAGVYRCRDWKLDWILTDLQKLKVWDSSHLGLSLLWALQIQIYLHKGLRRKVWILAGDFMLGPDDPLASRGILYFWPGSYIKIFLKSWEIDAKNIFHFLSAIGLCFKADWLVGLRLVESLYRDLLL